MAQATGGILQFAKVGSTWYRTHIFTSTESLVVTEAGNFRYLCVAGGGGGGNDMGGGGGGGGVLNGTLSMSTGSYLITVGAGGSGAPAGTGGLGTNGENSSIGSLIETIGGGRGASQHNGNSWNAGSGGSGGGGSGGRQSSSSYGGLPGTGTPGQGFDGAGSGPTWYPGGGGGAGGPGVGAGSVRGHGGPGKLDDILGIDYYWGGGGGGSGYSTTGGDGGIGGGGGGAVNTTNGGAGYNPGQPGGGGSVNAQTNRPGGNGGANTGGGGGGGSHFNSNNNGGAGGSGIVVLSYEIPPPPNAVGTGGTSYLVEQDGSWYLAHVFLQSDTFTATTAGVLEYLIVAGGGGGGGRHGGGGGGGGLISGLTEVTTTSYQIIVGAGGLGAQTDAVGGTGSDSSAFNLVAKGGGGGGSYTGNSWSAGASGGSGGGGGTLGGNSTGQGFSGGSRTNEEAGGGGGAGGVGENGGTNGGNGGPGKTNTILGGNSVTGYKWAGGGGGSAWQSRAGDGGTGGGGGGGAGDRTPGNEGLGGLGGFNPGQKGVSNTLGATSGGAGGSNTGGGGGGSGQRDYLNYTGVGGNGGSGIVIVRYSISAPDIAIASGGSEQQYELTPGKWYKLHTFSTNGSLEINQSGYLQYLVVAGGGGGGANGGGGGGAGGLITGYANLNSGTYSITVGTGGSGAANNTTAGSTGTNSVFHTFTAIGGGGGASRDGGGSSTTGGSGGGGGGGSTRTGGSTGTVAQGNSGGIGFDSTTNSAGGGGGGSATPGTNGGYQLAGRGGEGTLLSIEGISKYYAGGGGGGITTNGTASAGGAGGGGSGGASTTSVGTAGESGTGGGGGGGGSTGGAGGSGIVIVSYPIATPPLTTIIQTSTLTITAGVTITPTTPVFGTGGIGPRSFSIFPTLPDGLIFNISNAEISGAAEDIFDEEGYTQTSTYSVTVLDSTDTKSTATFNLELIYPPAPTATGGDISNFDSNGAFFKAHRFNSSDFFVLNTTATIEYLVVGGGGGGGSDMGGGGGAGGYRSGTVTLTSGTYNIIVGAGGTGGPAGTDQVRANSGNNSAIELSSYQQATITLSGFAGAVSTATNGLALTQPVAAWTTYRSLPSYLVGIPTTTSINDGDSVSFSTDKPVRAYMIRQTNWNPVDLTGWTELESGKAYITAATSGVSVYYRDYDAGGSYTIDNNSAMYMFDARIRDSFYIIAYGGGGGASDHTGAAITSAAVMGGSGGGASGNHSNRGLGYPGQGNAGSNSAGQWYPGGGGGAGGVGSTNPANGGIGKLNGILGTDYYWAGGGGGAGYSNWGGNGGLGGGGGGAPRTGTTQGVGDTNGVNPGQDATAGSLNSQTNVPGGAGGTNTGGGGGGGSHFNVNNTGGTGGSGIVVIRYQIPPPAIQTYSIITDNRVILNFYIPNTGIKPIAARYGTKPYTYAISPALPAGLSFSSSSGTITGQPEEEISATYLVTVTDANGDTSSTSFFLITSVKPLYALSLSAAISLSISSVFAVPFTDRTPAALILNDLRLDARQGFADPYLGFGTTASFENSDRIIKLGELLLSSGSGLLEIKYGKSLTISALPNLIYGFTSTDFTSTIIDHSSETVNGLDGKYVNQYADSITHSVYFDGVGDNLVINYNSALHLSADFTIECWFYANSYGGMILNFAGGASIAWASYELVNNSDGINFAASSNNGGYNIGSETGATGRMGTIQLGTWNHLAVTRSGNVYRGFVNGVQGYTQTLSLTPYDPNARGLVVGSNYSSTWGIGNPTSVVNGYISNLRIVKGTSLYNSNFTPPAEPLTAITDTSLLVCQSPTFVDNSNNNFTINRNGGAEISVFNPFGINYLTVHPDGSTVQNLTNATVIEGYLQDGNIPRPDEINLVAVPIFDASSTNNFNLNNQVSYDIVQVNVTEQSAVKENTAYFDLKLNVVNTFTPSEIVSQPIIKINIAQSPEPLRLITEDFSAELAIVNGEIDQITADNDPRLVTVQVPTFIEGQTGQPKQLWF